MTAIVSPATPTPTPGAQPSPQGADNALVEMSSFENVLAQIGSEAATLAGGQSVPLPLPAKPAAPTDLTTEAMIAAIAAMLSPVATPPPPPRVAEAGAIDPLAPANIPNLDTSETEMVSKVSTIGDAAPVIAAVTPLQEAGRNVVAPELAREPWSADGLVRPQGSPASKVPQPTPLPRQEIAPAPASSVALIEMPATEAASGAVEIQNTVPAAAPEITGTSAAKGGEVMPHPTQQHLLDLAPAIAEAAGRSPLLGLGRRVVSAAEAPRSPQPIPSSGHETVPQPHTFTAPPIGNAPSTSARTHDEPLNDGTADQHTNPHAFSFSPPSEIPALTTRPEPTAPISRTEIVHIADRMFEAATRLRTSGGERMEVAVRLESGHELTIRLHIANGEVTPVIRTDSDALKQALEQNWSQFTERGSDRGVRVATPIFESSQTSTDMADLSQQREDRQQAFTESAAEYPTPPPRSAPASSPWSNQTAAPQDSVQLYA